MKPVAMSQVCLLLSVLVSALVLATSTASAPRNSSQDQYEQRDDQAQTKTNEHKPLIHRVQLTSTGLHRFGLLPPKEKDLQVGCGDGSVKVPPKSGVGVQVINKKRMKRNAENTREKRDYIRWYGATTSQFNPPIQSYQIHGIQNTQAAFPFNVQYRRPAYSIVIPLWGNPQTIPVFFPPKPILFNPGYPVANRPQFPYPPALPTITTEKTPDTSMTSMTLDNRFGGPDEQDAPSWGIVESEEDTAAAPMTTRRPAMLRPLETVTKPPTPSLFHRPSHGEGGEGNIPQNNLEQQINQVFQTTTVRPRTTTTPPARTTTRSPERQLNRCVWAIISCCNPSNTQIRYNCFENLGCPGAFWDRNPCSKEVTQAALNAAQQFYDQS